jgi:hypothetical protein
MKQHFTFLMMILLAGVGFTWKKRSKPSHGDAKKSPR